MNIFSFVQNIELLQAVILMLGVFLMFLEIFIPGFGIAGASGIILVIIGIFLTAQTFMEGLVMFAILVLLIAILVAILIRSASKGKLSKILILNLSSKKEGGYSSTNDLTLMIGKTGTTITPLRPSGIASIDGQRLDVVSFGGYIDSKSQVKIVDVKGRRIVVEEVNKEQ